MADQDTIGLREAVSIGIGGMVGGGIFAVLGLAAKVIYKRIEEGRGLTNRSFRLYGLWLLTGAGGGR